MAKDRRIVLSSREEQKIEKAYLETAQGKAIFAMTFVACFALVIGLLIETYKVTNLDIINTDNLLFEFSQQLFMWGAIVALIGLFHYIRFAIGYKNVKPAKKATTKKAATKKTKTVEKKPEAKKTTTKKVATKATKTTKTTTKKK